MEAGPKLPGLKAMPNATPNAGGDRPSVGAFDSQKDRHNWGSSRTFSNTTSNAAARTSSLDGAFADSSVRVDHHSSDEGSFTRPAGYNSGASKSTTRPSSSVRANVSIDNRRSSKAHALRRLSSSQRFRYRLKTANAADASRRASRQASVSTDLRGVDGEPMTSSSPVAATSKGGTSNYGTSHASPWSSKRATMVGGPFNTLATK